MKAFKIAALILSVSMLISCSEKQPYIPKEHIGIPAEYERVLFEKGKRNDIQINMDDWDRFVQNTMTANHVFGDVNQVFKEAKYHEYLSALATEYILGGKLEDTLNPWG